MSLFTKPLGLLLLLLSCTLQAWATPPLPLPLDSAIQVPTASLRCTQAKITWKSRRADGALYAGRGSLVVLQAVASGATAPEALEGTPYIANSYLGAGQQLQPGQFVVYADTGHFVTVTGLQPNTVYRADVIASYDTVGGATAGPYYANPDPYQPDTEVTVYFATPACSSAVPPSQGAFGFSETGIDCSTVRLSVSSGNGDGRLLVVQRVPNGADGNTLSTEPQPGQFYFPSNLFGRGQSVGPEAYAISLGTDSTATLYGLKPGEHYKFVAYEYATERDAGGINTNANPAYAAPGDTIYFTVPLCGTTEPLVAATNLAQTDTTSSTVRITWANGSGTGRLVVVTPITNATGLLLPTQNTSSLASPAFGQGAQTWPGVFAVYAGTGNAVTITGLQPDSYYQAHVYEYNLAVNGSPTYLLSQAPATAYLKTHPLDAPQEPTQLRYLSSTATGYATGVTRISWKPGSGTHYMVLAQEVRATSIPLFQPVDGIWYRLPTNQQLSPAARIGGHTYLLQQSAYAGATDTIIEFRNPAIGHCYEMIVVEYVLDADGAPVYTPSQVMGFRSSRLHPVLTGEVINGAPALQIDVAAQYHADYFKLYSSADDLRYSPVGTVIPITQDSVLTATRLSQIMSPITEPTYFKVEMHHRDGEHVYSNSLLLRPGKPLPVELTRFSGRLDATNYAELRWLTASERNSAYFEVERSPDGRAYQAIGRQAAAGSSTQPLSYQLRDSQPLQQTTYYRLRQVDLDGKQAYSSVVVLQPETPSPALTIYPNPAPRDQRVSLQLLGVPPSALAGGLRITIRSMAGQILERHELAPSQREWSWYLTGYSPGTYLVEVQSTAGRYVGRLVVN